ncbi:MAG: hypothetical protein HZB31_09240 [Nitrospirae bacterium]|nr:hypothetical protein [Nitrospirota bacterium]
MNFQYIQITLIISVVLMFVILVFFVVKQILAYQKKRDEQENRERTQITFVVDTFHDLMSSPRHS